MTSPDVLPNSTLSAEFQNGLPTRVRVGETVIGNHWGFETADRGTFFSLTEAGWNASKTVVFSQANAEGSKATIDARLSESRYTVDVSSWLHNGAILREVTGHAVRDSILQDFVCRFTFRADLFPVGEIAGRRFSHRSSNVWHQFPVDSASVSGPIGRVVVNATHFEGGGKFRLECYLRDEPTGLWILHLRLMPIDEDLYWIRWHTRIGTIVKLTGWSARAIMKISAFRHWLWYRAERRGGRPNLQGQPLAKIDAGTKLQIASTTTFEPI